VKTESDTELFRIAVERDIDPDETSDEAFDRMAFAERALSLLKPPGMRVVLCEGRTVGVFRGRQWARPGGTWAMLSVPRRASRHAIAVAVVSLADGSKRPAPYVVDALFGASVTER
jgi:hypothetical protein